MNVRLPAGPGPYPTLVEYSGYGYANPDGAESSISQIANVLGYAVVDVNMRGTGCSGGAFDYFEPLQGLDGYDVVETVARQPWVKGKPGMVGLSYGGISQLFVAATKPPSLAAITPLSVIDSTQTTLYPGGILNTGFALSWAKDRVHDAKPASATGGQPWALKRIREGDKTCKANQALHPEAVDLLAKTERNRFYVPEVADPLAPVTFVHRIRVPTFLACQWTDEQTGGHCPTLASRFTGTDRKWFTFTNGTARRLARPRDLQPLVRLPRAVRRPPGAAAPARDRRARAGDLPDDLRGRRRAARARPDPGGADVRGGARRVRGAAAGAGRVRQRRGHRRRAGRRLRALVPALAGPRHGGALVLPRRGRDARGRAAARRARTGSRGSRARGPRPTSPATPARGRTGSGPPRRPTTGARTRPAPPSPTRRRR